MTIAESINAFIKIWVDQNELYSKQCIVASVDVDKRTATCAPVDGGADILNVYLEGDYDPDADSAPSGFFVVPKVGSTVIVTFIDRDQAHITAWTEIGSVVMKADQFTFNAGENLGLVKITELTNRIKELEALFTELKNNMSAWVPVNNDGGRALKTLLNEGFLTKTIPDSKISDFENPKVKH